MGPCPAHQHWPAQTLVVTRQMATALNSTDQRKMVIHIDQSILNQMTTAGAGMQFAAQVMPTHLAPEADCSRVDISLS